MINRAAIQQWSEHAPWIDNAQIEQDFNLSEKMNDTEFTNDMQTLLRPNISFNPTEAYQLVYDTFIDKMVGRRD